MHGGQSLVVMLDSQAPTHLAHQVQWLLRLDDVLEVLEAQLLQLEGGQIADYCGHKTVTNGDQGTVRCCSSQC